MTDKKLTRHEYYTSLGFSGTTLDRPDDPVDAEFIEHCKQLKTFAENFINHCKSGDTPAKFIDELKDEDTAVDYSDFMNASVKTTENMLAVLKELTSCYAQLYNYAANYVPDMKNITSTSDFINKSFGMMDDFHKLIGTCIKQQRLTDDKLSKAITAIQFIQQQTSSALTTMQLKEILKILTE